MTKTYLSIQGFANNNKTEEEMTMTNAIETLTALELILECWYDDEIEWDRAHEELEKLASRVGSEYLAEVVLPMLDAENTRLFKRLDEIIDLNLEEQKWDKLARFFDQEMHTFKRSRYGEARGETVFEGMDDGDKLVFALTFGEIDQLDFLNHILPRLRQYNWFGERAIAQFLFAMLTK